MALVFPGQHWRTTTPIIKSWVDQIRGTPAASASKECMSNGDLAHWVLLLSMGDGMVSGRKPGMGMDKGPVGFLISEVDLSLSGTCDFLLW